MPFQTSVLRRFNSLVEKDINTNEPRYVTESVDANKLVVANEKGVGSNERVHVNESVYSNERRLDQ
jgi:hypothetical protein